MKEYHTIPQLKKSKILLIGDSCIDRYVFGTCERLNPEAPVPVLSITHTYETGGMAANVERNLQVLGADVDFMTSGAKSVKTRYIDTRSGQHIIRVDDDKHCLPFHVYSDLALTQYNAIVISDYNKGYVTYENIKLLREVYHGPIYIDTKKHDLGHFNGCIVKINNYEYALAKTTADCMIVTNGSRPVVYYDDRWSIKESFNVTQADVVDVCGAGDTFLAAFVIAHLTTNDIPQSIKFAIKASSITVQHQGVYAPTIEEINV